MSSSPFPFLFQPTLRAARAGDQEALELLFDELYPKVQALVHNSLARDLDSKRRWMAALFSTGDMVQDVFRSLLRELPSVEAETEEALIGYLATVIRHRIIDALRFHEAARRDQRRASVDLADVQVSATQAGPATWAGAAEEMRAFCQVLDSFPERTRLLLRERLELCTPFAQIAQDLAYPAADTARKAFYSAHAQLLLRLRERGIKAPGED